MYSADRMPEEGGPWGTDIYRYTIKQRAMTMLTRNRSDAPGDGLPAYHKKVHRKASRSASISPYVPIESSFPAAQCLHERALETRPQDRIVKTSILDT